MKTSRSYWLLSALAAFLFAASLSAQDVNPADSTGLPGDGFSLEGAIELFKKAESPEAFEKMLNTEDNSVNNLDLNEDGQTDYIRVVDNMDKDVHAIVLQVPVSESESQDIAVIEIEKTGAESATLQIVGDEDIFGTQTIAEPFEEETQQSGKNGPAMNQPPVRIVVNVWLWPPVRFMYRPGYVVYASPWRWRAYPGWWRPWRPHPWRVFHVRVRPYRAHCHVVTVHRVGRAHAVYAPRRTHSTVVHTRTTTRVQAGRGHATRTTTTTTVQGPRGHTAAQKTTTTTKVKGPKGNTRAQKTTTRTTRRRG